MNQHVSEIVLEFNIFLVLNLHQPLILKLVLIDLRLLNTLDIVGNDRLLLIGGVVNRCCNFLICCHHTIFFFINIVCLFKIIFFVLFILNIFILSIVSGMIGLFLLLWFLLFSIVDPEVRRHCLHLGIFFINRVSVAVLWVDVLMLLKFLIHLLLNMVCLLIVQI